VTAPEKSTSPHLSIVVLSFKNLSSDSSQDYFADGLTENLTTDGAWRRSAIGEDLRPQSGKNRENLDFIWC